MNEPRLIPQGFPYPRCNTDPTPNEYDQAKGWRAAMEGAGWISVTAKYEPDLSFAYPPGEDPSEGIVPFIHKARLHRMDPVRKTGCLGTTPKQALVGMWRYATGRPV